MKNLTNMMIAAAALMVAAGAAQAQVMKAEVPFSFRAAGTVMPAGEYWVQPVSMGSRIFSLANLDANRTVLALPYATNSRAHEAGSATLTFECTGTQCALIQIAPGNGEAYLFSHPKMGRNEDTRVALIRAVLVKAR